MKIVGSKLLMLYREMNIMFRNQTIISPDVNSTLHRAFGCGERKKIEQLGGEIGCSDITGM